jgi:pyruvate formate lyase activating enzyme
MISEIPHNNDCKPAPLICWDIYLEALKKTKCCLQIPVGGFIKQSLVDFPGNVAAVIFLAGCNLRCSYCHNTSLVHPDSFKKAEWPKLPDICEWLEQNRTLLDGVVITGGEPTIYPNLPLLVEKINALGLKVKLDTNGTNPKLLKALISEGMVDYVAMDIKAPLVKDKYEDMIGSKLSDEIFKKIKKSIAVLIEGEVFYEFRTTNNGSLSCDDIEAIISEIKGKYFLQGAFYKGGKLVNVYSEDDEQRIIKMARRHTFVQLRFRK